MKASLCTVALLISFSIRAGADFTIVQKVEGMEGKAQAREITLKLKGDKVRLEATPQMTTIVDGRTGDIVTLMNAQKKIVRISGDKAKAIAEMAAKYGGTTQETPKLTATGKKTTINNYETEEYVAETKMYKARYWIAPSFPNSAAIMKELQAVIPAAWNDLFKGALDYRGLPGFPLRTQVKLGDTEVITNLVSVKTDTLSDAEFSVPKDFQEVKIPNVEISAEKPEPTASAKP